MPQLRILLPGPWWHELTYLAESDIPVGARVAVPMGKGMRVGICMGQESAPSRLKLRNISVQLDEEPVLSRPYLSAVKSVAQTYLCSQGDLLRNILPAAFWKGEPFPAYREGAGTPSTEFFYRYSDAERLDRWRREIIDAHGGVLCLFPERQQAKLFHDSLKGIISKDRLILWPDCGGQTLFKAWRKTLGCSDSVVIGGPGAAAAPMPNPELIIIESENNPVWRAQKQPCVSLRSFAAARASFGGARLITGGRMPSSRIYKKYNPPEPPVPRGKNTVRFIDIAKAPQLSFRGICNPIPVSDVLVSETLELTRSGRIVFWLLDRRGLSNQLCCADCGRQLTCPKCGTPLSFERNGLRCPLCGHTQPQPHHCPSCGGTMLQGASPGLQALLPAAKNLLGNENVVLWHLDDPSTVTEARRRAARLKKNGGLLLGSRRALSLLDLLDPALICWLNADAETRYPRYDARANAYAMLLESCWRGGGQRQVILQTYRIGQAYLRALQLGWGYFWQREASEREPLGFPPDSYLVEIRLPEGWSHADGLMQQLDDAGFTVMCPDTAGRTLTVLTPALAPLRKILGGYYTIKNSREGYPLIRVWTD